MAMRAQRIASKLMVEVCGAKLVPGTIDEAAEIPEPHRVKLRTDRVEGLLGVPIEEKLCKQYLERLDFDVKGKRGEIEAVVPVHRHYDVTREADLIEEVGRIHGYADHLPPSVPDVGAQVGRLDREQTLRRRAEDVMRDLGFHALVTLSLTHPDEPGRLRIPDGDPRAQPIRVSNPLSTEHSVERTTLLGSLLGVAQYNLARGAEGVAVYESARAHLREGHREGGVLAGNFVGRRPAPAYEPHRIACLASGPLRTGGWRSSPVQADFFAIKGALEALGAQLGVSLEVEPAEQPFLHPGRSGRITVDGDDVGWIGEVHPLVCRAWDLDGAAGFELDLAPVVAASPYGEETYEDVVSFPPVHQDVAVVVGEDVPAAEVRRAVMAGGGELLRSAEVFDLYRGEQVGEGRKSLALRLSFGAPDRTLTDDEVAGRRTAITEALEGIGGSLRE
jgi:phenylalanyl-tRNA synthetase beta chain